MIMAKEKQTRTYDQDGFRRRAACLCVRDPEESEIMLVTSSRTPEHWIVPGGGVEPNEDPNEAAIRETEEEAGVKGVLKRSLGDIEVCDVENIERKHRTSVYVLEVREELDVWEDSKSRKRCWFSVKEALNLLAIYKPVQCTYVKLMIQTSPSLSLRRMLSNSMIITSSSVTTNHNSLPPTTVLSERHSKNHKTSPTPINDSQLSNIIGSNDLHNDSNHETFISTSNINSDANNSTVTTTDSKTTIEVNTSIDVQHQKHYRHHH